MTAVAKGVRQKKPTINSGLIKPFLPLYVSWIGNRELKSLTHLEMAGQTDNRTIALTGKQLYCGMYANELMIRLTHPFDPHPGIYEAYESLLCQLSTTQDLELPLRRFELLFLTELGYGFDFDLEAATGESIVADKTYIFHADSGFTEINATVSASLATQIFSGAEIQTIGKFATESPLLKPAAKRLMRLALNERLGGKTLKSRDLFKTF